MQKNYYSSRRHADDINIIPGKKKCWNTCCRKNTNKHTHTHSTHNARAGYSATANWPLSATADRPQSRLYFICSFPMPSPLSTDSCFLTKPTLFQADPVIMRLCPELQATREQCQQLGADLLNGLASPHSPREQKLHLIVWVESGSSPRGISKVQYQH